MTAAAPARRARPGNFAAATVGLGALAAFLLAVEILIQIGVVNRFIVPPPSEIIGSFGRVIVEENVFGRFLLTASECLIAGVMLTVFGVAGGVLMHRFKLLQQACETWVAAMASAPIVLMYPLFLVIFGRNAWTIIMMGFVAALPPVILKTIEGISGTRKVLVNVGRSFNLTPTQQFWKILFPAALADHFRRRAAGLDLRADQCRRRGIPDQFRRARPAHQRARRTLRPRRHLCGDLFRDSGERVVLHGAGKG